MLTDKAIQRLKSREKLYRVADRDGLCLEVTPGGTKLWRYRYRVGGREKMIALRGAYPETSLAEARQQRDDQRKILSGGVDPSLQRKRDRLLGAEAASNTFESVAGDWLATKKSEWVEDHVDKVDAWLKQHVFPVIGATPVGDIDAPAVLAMLKRIVARGTIDTAARVRQTVSAVFRYAIASGRALQDPAASLRDALPRPNGGNFAAITDKEQLGELLRAIDGYRGSAVTLAALKLAPHVFVRPAELRGARWSEFDLEKAEWRIPAARRKLKKRLKENARTAAHIVPLSTQVLAILRDLEALTGTGTYLFPSVRTPQRPMSDNTVLAGLRRLGFDSQTVSGHGFRHTASTFLNERNWNADAIERQLSHRERDEVRGVYNKAQLMEVRRGMMQDWSDYLDRLRADAHLVPLGKARGEA